jgi:hypothetical protein
MAFALNVRARLSLVRTGGPLSTRQAWLDATDRSVAPPDGLPTLRFDPARFQAESPTCYWTPWRSPGPDSHRLATTSL